jgi:hypothetical protein
LGFVEEALAPAGGDDGFGERLHEMHDTFII